jgi:hypothetical protein
MRRFAAKIRRSATGRTERGMGRTAGARVVAPGHPQRSTARRGVADRSAEDVRNEKRSVFCAKPSCAAHGGLHALDADHRRRGGAPGHVPSRGHPPHARRASQRDDRVRRQRPRPSRAAHDFRRAVGARRGEHRDMDRRAARRFARTCRRSGVGAALLDGGGRPQSTASDTQVPPQHSARDRAADRAATEGRRSLGTNGDADADVGHFHPGRGSDRARRVSRGALRSGRRATLTPLGVVVPHAPAFHATRPLTRSSAEDPDASSRTMSHVRGRREITSLRCGRRCLETWRSEIPGRLISTQATALVTRRLRGSSRVTPTLTSQDLSGTLKELS